MNHSGRQNQGRRIPELDGIRGTAILTVLLFHWIQIESVTRPFGFLHNIGAFGWTGVDLFFVLSGFLIGGILIDARGAENFFRVFYARRFLRILPLFVLVLGAAWLLSWSGITRGSEAHGWLFEEKFPYYLYLTFFQNVFMAFAGSMNARVIDGSWSLAVEEQFYATLPLLVRFVKPRLLPYVLAIGVIAAPCIRIALHFYSTSYVPGTTIYLLAPCRMDALFLGVLAAWATRQENLWQRICARKGILYGLTCFFLFGIVLMAANHWSFYSFGVISFGYTWIAVAYTLLLMSVLARPGNIVSRLLCTKPLVALGIGAYGIYLLHQPLLGLMHWALRDGATPKLVSAQAWLLTGVAFPVLFALSWLSWKYFEHPFVRLGHSLRYRFAKATQEPSPEQAAIVASGKEHALPVARV